MKNWPTKIVTKKGTAWLVVLCKKNSSELQSLCATSKTWKRYTAIQDQTTYGSLIDFPCWVGWPQKSSWGKTSWKSVRPLLSHWNKKTGWKQGLDRKDRRSGEWHLYRSWQGTRYYCWKKGGCTWSETGTRKKVVSGAGRCCSASLGEGSEGHKHLQTRWKRLGEVEKEA